VSNQSGQSRDQDLSEDGSKLGDTSQSSESEHISSHNSKGILSSFTETDASDDCFHVSMSTDVPDDSFKAGSTALQASDDPTDVLRNMSLFLGFFDFLVDVSQHNLNGPNNREEQSTEGNSTDMSEESPAECSADWGVKVVSIWGEVPDYRDSGNDEIVQVDDEGHVPQKSEHVEVPQDFDERGPFHFSPNGARIVSVLSNTEDVSS
jgi:hypothetical protein